MTKIEKIEKLGTLSAYSGHLRRGQSLMNALHEVDPQAYIAITGTSSDCFFSDEQIPRFWSFVTGWFSALGEI